MLEWLMCFLEILDDMHIGEVSPQPLGSLTLETSINSLEDLKLLSRRALV